MPARVFLQAFQNIGVVTAITADAVGHYDFDGSTAARQAHAAAAALRAGAGLADIECKKAKVVPIATIDRVARRKGEVFLAAPQAGGRVKIRFDCEPASEAEQVARDLAGSAGLLDSERAEPVALRTAVLIPIALGLVAGWLWGVLYYVGSKIARGDTADLNLDVKGKGQIILVIANAVGMTGVYAIGGALLLGFIGWIALRVVRRPTQTVWGAATA